MWTLYCHILYVQYFRFYLRSFLLVREWPQYADIWALLQVAKGRGGDISGGVGELALKEPEGC